VHILELITEAKKQRKDGKKDMQCRGIKIEVVKFLSGYLPNG
jgi:hypothetical protein